MEENGPAPNFATLAQVVQEQRDAAINQVAFVEAQLRTVQQQHALEVASLKARISELEEMITEPAPDPSPPQEPEAPYGVEDDSSETGG